MSLRRRVRIFEQAARTAGTDAEMTLRRAVRRSMIFLKASAAFYHEQHRTVNDLSGG